MKVEFTGTHTPMRLCTSVSPWEVEVCNSLLVEANVPPDHNIVLCLGLLQSLVIVSLQFHQGAKDVLVAVGVLVPVSREGGEGRGKKGKGRGRRGGGEREKEVVMGKRDVQLSPQCISISILQYITVYYSILQYTTVYHYSILQYITVYHSLSQYITVYHSILHLLKLHLVRLSVHAWFLEVFQCCFRITL